MNGIKLTRLATIFGCLLTCSLASAQLDSTPSSASETQLVLEQGGAIKLNDGDVIRYKDRDFVVGRDSNAIPNGADVSVGGKAGKIKRKFTISAALYPIAVFGIGGALIRKGDGGLTGGTAYSTGSVVSLDTGMMVGKQQSVELGGFYYRSFADDVDLYQIDVRYFPLPTMGLQIGYLNSSNFDASTMSYHLVWRLANLTDGVHGVPLSAEIGFGFMNDLSKDTNVSSGLKINRSSVSLSTFAEISLKVSKNLSVMGSSWFFQDRNDMISRFGVGVGYKF